MMHLLMILWQGSTNISFRIQLFMTKQQEKHQEVQSIKEKFIFHVIRIKVKIKCLHQQILETLIMIKLIDLVKL